jgi:hypothetical protein
MKKMDLFQNHQKCKLLLGRYEGCPMIHKKVDIKYHARTNGKNNISKGCSGQPGFNRIDNRDFHVRRVITVQRYTTFHETNCT